MKLKELILNTATVLAAAAAIWVTVSTRGRGAAQAATESTAAATTTHVSNWPALLASGHRIGPKEARLTVVEFGDFECPACAAFAAAVDTMRRRHPRDFAVVFHHYPLPYHRLAYPLSRAAECADKQGRFVEFHDAVYARRSSLGVVPVTEFGAVAGVPDLALFGQCVRDTLAVAAVEADMRTGRAIPIPGTPGIFIDGTLMSGAMTVQMLERELARKQRAHN